MKADNVVTTIWKNNEHFIVKSFLHHEYDDFTSFTDVLSKIFCAGPCYYYVLDFETRKIEYISPSVEQILGLKPDEVQFNDIVGCVHPDDLKYIQIAEKFNLEKIAELDADLVPHIKLAYCFREKTASGKYEMFQMQAVWVNLTGNPDQAKLMNIHTNIHHLTPENNYLLTLSSVKDSNFFLRYDLKKQMEVEDKPNIFSKRELEIIALVTQGYESEEIAERLCLSAHTIKTHRRNVQYKAGVKNAAQLVRYCLDKGLI